MTRHPTLRLLRVLAVAAAVLAPAATSSAEPASDSAVPLVTLDRDGFRIDVTAATASVGKVGTASVKVTAKDGFKVNAEYPHKLSFDVGPVGLRLEKTSFRKEDAAADGTKSLTFSVKATADAPGKHMVDATLKTSVCNAQSCILKTERFQIAFAAK